MLEVPGSSRSGFPKLEVKIWLSQVDRKSGQAVGESWEVGTGSTDGYNTRGQRVCRGWIGEVVVGLGESRMGPVE